MSTLITPRYQSFEMKLGQNALPQGAGQITFQQIPQLQSFYDTNYLVYLLALKVYTADEVPFSPYDNNQPLATFQDLQNATLTLVRVGDQAHMEVPMVEFHTFTSPVNQMPYSRDVFRFPDEWQIDWTKSFVHNIKATPTTGPFSMLFGAHYSYYPTTGSGILPQPWHFTGASRQR
jgi:hypothetical protein